MEKYVQRAKELGMVDALLITPQDIVFDLRTLLKCRWGCEDFFHRTIKCHPRETTFQERVEMIKHYSHVLLLHSHNARDLSIAVLDIEKTAFFDGYYFAFGIRYCNLCQVCSVDQGKPCPTPTRVRPCDQTFGIDVYKTAQNLGLPCYVLQNRDERQNRYGFVLLE